MVQPTPNEQTLRQDLAAAYRLLDHYGWTDLIFTHASLMIPGTHCYLTNQFGLRFDEVTASNLITVDFDGRIVGTDQHIPPWMNIIHSAIHQARPDAQCIIHTHTPAGIAVSADRDGVWPISQKAAICLASLGYHDNHGLTVDHTEGPALVKSLESNNFLVLRNHGLLTVGPSVASAFTRMRTLERVCEAQVLCDADQVVQLSNSMLEHIGQQLNDPAMLSNLELAWLALIRLVEKFYPDYKT